MEPNQSPNLEPAVQGRNGAVRVGSHLIQVLGSRMLGARRDTGMSARFAAVRQVIGWFACGRVG